MAVQMRTPSLAEFHKGLRSPWVAPLTRALLGVPLIFLTLHTDRFFAWTIKNPLTAAVLGANYWASATLAVLASRRKLWAFGRISVPIALVFAPLTTLATFLHFSEFHTGSFFGWFWIVAYGVYPPMLVYLLLKQLKIGGEDPPREDPLPRWLRGIFWGHVVVLLPIGLLLLVSPKTAQGPWPWDLTSLTSQILAAWLMGLAVLAGHALWENDFQRVKVALYTYPLLGALHVAALMRFHQFLHFGEPGAWVYLAFIASTFVLGAYGFVEGRRRPHVAWEAPAAPGLAKQ